MSKNQSRIGGGGGGGGGEAYSRLQEDRMEREDDTSSISFSFSSSSGAGSPALLFSGAEKEARRDKPGPGEPMGVRGFCVRALGARADVDRAQPQPGVVGCVW
jgi:hypothetical protein